MGDCNLDPFFVTIRDFGSNIIIVRCGIEVLRFMDVIVEHCVKSVFNSGSFHNAVCFEIAILTWNIFEGCESLSCRVICKIKLGENEGISEPRVFNGATSVRSDSNLKTQLSGSRQLVTQ